MNRMKKTINCQYIRGRSSSPGKPAVLTPDNAVAFFCLCCIALQEDVLLEVDDLYRLLLDLPEMVDEDSAFATFNKKERRLTLRVDVL